MRTVIVAGPPGSGKTTYVNERRRWGDLVVDLDALWVALSGQHWYEKPSQLLPVVLRVRDTLLDMIAEGIEGIDTAWVITSEPNGLKRHELARRLGATVVVLEISPAECARRIGRDERRADKVHLWRPLIQKWWDNYARAPSGEVVVR